MRLKTFAVLVLTLVLSQGGAALAASDAPTVAVLSDTGGQDASELADALTSALVSRTDVRVIDRRHINDVLATRQSSAEGQVTPETELEVGRTLGVRYLLICRVQTASTSTGRSLPGGIRVPGLGVPIPSFGSGPKLDLASSVDVIEVKSDQIVQSLSDHRSGGVGSEGRSDLVHDAAVALAGKLDVSHPTTSVARATGQILDVSDGTVTLSLGSDSGLHPGDTVDAFDSRVVANPETGKTIHTLIKRGTLQVVQVESDYSVAKPLGGFHALKFQVVRTGS